MRFLILSLFIMQSAWAVECNKNILAFLKKSKDLPMDEVQYKLLKQIQTLEKKTNKLRVKKSNSEPAINLKIWKKIAHYDALLANDSYSQVTRELRPLFREVESAYVIIKRYEKVQSVLKEGGFSSAEELITKLKQKEIHDELVDAIVQRYTQNAGDLKKLDEYYQSVINENAIHLGHFYHEYKLIRKHLETIIDTHNCDNHCAVNTKNLLNAIGVESFTDQERFAVLLKGAKTPGWADLNRTLNAHPLAYTTRLKRERDEEFKLFWKGLFYEILPTDEIANVLLRTPVLNKSKAIRLMRLVYDRVARLVHFPKINRIMRSPLEIPEKFDMFLQLNTTVVPEDELMVTFARRIDMKTKDAWEQMYKHATENQDRYPDILKRMTNAKEKAMARGEISLVHEKSFTTKLAIILSAGGSIAYYHFNKSEVEEVIEDINVFEDEENSELAPTKDEQEEFGIDGKALAVKIGSNEDAEMETIVEEVIKLTKDITVPERKPDSKKVFIIPLRLIKEI